VASEKSTGIAVHTSETRRVICKKNVSIHHMSQALEGILILFPILSFVYGSWRSIVIYNWNVLFVRKSRMTPFFEQSTSLQSLSVRSGPAGGTDRGNEDSRRRCQIPSLRESRGAFMGVIQLGNLRGPANGRHLKRSTVDSGGACPLLPLRPVA